tara:strand:+ start:17 stop:889 length:873 start_codon:yes stop_codon:yes gene_type:complete
MREYTYEFIAKDYREGNEDVPVLKITKSSFGTFQWCPLKFQYQYPFHFPQETTEPMIKGTAVHDSRQDWFDDYDIAKASELTESELITYGMGLYPIDDYGDIYINMARFDAKRFTDAKEQDKLSEFLPVVNEVMLDAEIIIPFDANPKLLLKADYIVHLQGIVDRVFVEDNKYIPMELKTGPWKDSKTTSMRKEMAFYKLLIENASDESLAQANLDRDIPITHWGWYFPVSNYLHTEKVKKSSMTALMRGITQMINAYEEEEFPAKYYWKKCEHCSFNEICPAAQEGKWL